MPPLGSLSPTGLLRSASEPIPSSSCLAVEAPGIPHGPTAVTMLLGHSYGSWRLLIRCAPLLGGLLAHYILFVSGRDSPRLVSQAAACSWSTPIVSPHRNTAAPLASGGRPFLHLPGLPPHRLATFPQHRSLPPVRGAAHRPLPWEGCSLLEEQRQCDVPTPGPFLPPAALALSAASCLRSGPPGSSPERPSAEAKACWHRKDAWLAKLAGLRSRLGLTCYSALTRQGGVEQGLPTRGTRWGTDLLVLLVLGLQ